MPTPLKATIRDIQGETAVLHMEDQQTLRLPMTAIEGTPKPGSDVLLLAVAPGGEDAGRHAMAKHLLNELLGSSHS